MDEENWDDYRFALALLRAHSVAGAARLLNVNETTVARRLTHAVPGACQAGSR